MEKELIKFIEENNLSLFNENSQLIRNDESIFKTKDAKAIFNKVLDKISQEFIFKDTGKLLDALYFTQDINEIKNRQSFFSKIPRKMDNSFLKDLTKPISIWSPRYEIVAVTADEKTFVELKELGCPVKFITSSEDVRDLEACDIIQAVDCEDFTVYLEQLNQVIFINNTEDIYLERYLELLSGWKKNIDILEKNISSFNEEDKKTIAELKSLLGLINEIKSEKLTSEKVDQALEEINENVSQRIKNVNISGSQLFEMLSKNSLSKDILDIIEQEIEKTKLPEEIFTKTMPVNIDARELDRVLKEQDSNEFIAISEKIKRKSKELKEVPEKLKRLESLILLFDFYAGISQFVKDENTLAEHSEEFLMDDSKNIFIDGAQPISFILTNNHRCSILTGANSGGKTTLLEHIIQLISLFQLGVPTSGKVKMPIFSEIYYFAKNKGSTNKGAFETLLTQMSKITPGKQTLILADEIESVTEPGVAGKVLSATADYFIKKNCFLVIATHLGQEIQKNLPPFARIDGIEAKGLDENYDLIVSHNPILGRLAHSTPELIVEKMANSPKTKSDYISYINNAIKNKHY
jgi:hypothetical protein